ncbi:MAG TPA: trypsin-like peptidase domain-containing protein [Rugosimonospora sp.]|nr:trypsin-like peptidase domain-containing protein [Rugosimonospora sp.]
MSESDTTPQPPPELVREPAREPAASAGNESTSELPRSDSQPPWAVPAVPAPVPFPQPGPAYPQPVPPFPQSAPPFPQSGPPYPQSGPPGSAWQRPGPQPVGAFPAPQPAWHEGPGYPPPGIPPQSPYGIGPLPAQSGPGGGGPRIGRVLAIALLGLLLAGGGGVVGGVVVHATDANNSSGNTSRAASSTRGSATALDRSSLAGIVAGVKDSVVSIFTQDAEGSGVVLDTAGHILTNNHVVADAQNSTVRVTFASGNSVPAKILGTDAKTDMAVVQVSGVSGLTAAKFGDSDALQVGDSVIAIGSPLGLDGSVTAGIVSALNRTIDESASQQNPFSQQQSQAGTAIAGAIQTDAAINPGNSGGALVNMAGEVIGINTAIATSDTGSSGNIGVGFAIPSNRAKEVANSLIKGEKVSHPYIGVGVGTANGNAGAQVSTVVNGGPASKAGVQQGDVITKAGGTDIHTSDDLLNVVQAAKVGDQLQLTVTRSGSQKSVTVTIGESPN